MTIKQIRRAKLYNKLIDTIEHLNGLAKRKFPNAEVIIDAVELLEIQLVIQKAGHRDEIYDDNGRIDIEAIEKAERIIDEKNNPENR